MALCPLIQKITREIYGSIQAERSIVIRTLPNPTHSVVKCASLQSDGFLYPIQIGQRYYKAAHAITKTAI